MHHHSVLPWYDLATLESLPEVFLDIIMSDSVPNLLLHSHLPSQHLLVGKAEEGKHVLQHEASRKERTHEVVLQAH